MEQRSDIMKQYDTPENRQAYLSYKASVGNSDGFAKLDTPENRQQYERFMGTSEGQAFRLNTQMLGGLSTSDNRLYKFSSEQVNWIQRQYSKSWEYGHDAFDQAAKANGSLPPSLYDKYNEKSQYDQWAMQTGMPNEKDLEKYLKDYDDWKTQYDADEAAFNQALADREASEALLENFYNDVADRLYRAEFDGVQRGSDDWNTIFFSALNEPKYASLKPLYAGAAYEAPVEGKSSKKKTESTQLTEDEKFHLAWFNKHPPTSERFLQMHQQLLAKAEAAKPEAPEDIDAIVADKGYYFPEVPDLTFSIGDFTEMFDRNVTKYETDRGYGKVNNAVREAAGKIGYSIDSDPLSDLYISKVNNAVREAAGKIMGGSGEQTSGGGLSVRNSGKSGLLPKSEGSSLIQSGRTSEKHDYKVPNRTDVASVCKDLAIQGFNSEEYWQVIGGLTAGSPLSPDTPGPGFVFDSATQERTGAYGQVISTRFGTDIMKLAVNGASSEDIDAFIAEAVESGATRELLWNTYDLVMAALGGSSESDTSRDWDGLSYAERTARDAAFNQRFEAAANAAPSLPIGSGWSQVRDPEEIKRLSALRDSFDFEEEFKNYKPADEEADKKRGFVDWVTDFLGKTSNPIYQTVALAENHDVAKSEYTASKEYKAYSRFRTDAKAHGYSDWEVDEFFRKEGIADASPEENLYWDLYDIRKAENYRAYLIESALMSAPGNGSENPAVQYFETLSSADLVSMMKTDASVSSFKHAWAVAPNMMITRGALSYAAGFINFADMIASNFEGSDASAVTNLAADFINQRTQNLGAVYRHDDQSSVVGTIVDAGSELYRMYLTAKTGAAFGKVVGGALSYFGATGSSAAVTASTWLSSGSKAANLVRWGVESVPFVTSAMGSSYAEARAEGASVEEATAYGVLAGVVEGLTEKMGADIMFGKLGNAAIGGIMKSGVAKILTGKTGVLAVNLIKMAMNASSEAVEEGSSYVLDTILKKLIYDPDAQFSGKELLSQMGMGALTGAMGLAFQNYGASYVNSMMEFALSSSKNFQTFSNWAVNQYGANLGTNDNYVVKAEDYDPTKILPASEWNQAWTDYLDANATLSSARKQYEATVASLNEDDAQKAREVMYWKNQIAAGDPSDPKSAAAMAHAMEQLTLAESKAADTEKKNKKLRQDARTELTNARKRAQNIMDETSAKIRAHSRAEIAATLGAANASLDSSYALFANDADAAAARAERAAALQAQLEETQTYAAAIDEAYNALEQLERASEAQKEAKAKLYDAAVSTLSAQYDSKPVIAGALDKLNALAQAQDALAEGLEATADEMAANMEQAKKEDQIRTANFAADLDSIDSWYGAEIDQIDADMVEAERDARDGKITKDEYEAKKEEAAARIQTAMENRDATRQAAAENFAAEGGVAQGMEGLANAMRLEASEARAKATEIRNAVVRALALRTQEAAFAAIDAITTGEGVLTVDQREALSDEMNRLIAEQLMNDEATKAVYDAMEGLKLAEQQAEQKGTETPSQTASEAQEGTVQSEQESASKTTEERQAELRKAVAVGKALGVDVQIVDNLPKELNGKYFDDGRILINRNATNAPMQVLVHELAHYMEGTAAYDQLQQYVFSTMAADPNFNLSIEIAAYRTLYAQSRDAMGEAQLSDEDAIKEAKAEIVSRWCEKNLFTSEESINRLCSQETSLGKRILNGIQNMLSGKRRDPALAQLQTAEKLYIKALNEARAFGGAKINRNSVASLLVGAGLYVDPNADGFKVYRTRYNENGDRISIEELKPNLESPCDGPITTDDIMNHSPIGAFIRLGQQFGNIEGFYDTELEPGTNLRAIPSDRLSVGAKIVNLFTDLSNMCLAYGDNGMVWDFVGGYVFSSITSNSDPQYSRTVDYGTICRKTQNLITAMSEAMVQKGRGLYADEIIELSNELVRQGKLDVPYSMCYVFNRWLGLGGYLNRIKVYQDRYAAMTPDEALKAFQDVQAQIDEVVGSRNFKTLINELCDQHGIDPKAYLKELAESNKAFRETGKFQATKREMSKSDARTRAIQLYAKLLDDCAQSHDRKSLSDVDTKALMNDLETRMGVTDAYGWFTKVLLNENEDGTFSLKRSVLSEDGKSWATGADGNASFVVPTEILFNLNASDRFASEYPDVWRFRTAGGSALGKATYGYTDARLGEFTYGAAVSNVKSQDVPKAPRWGVGGETSTAENQPKNKLSFVDSRGEFTTGGAATFAKAVRNILNQAWLGGDRMQTSSDYTSRHALDYLITAFEMQCLGAPVQTYTKVPEALAFFNAIGASANGSLIAKGGGVSGTPVYEFNEASGHYRVVEGSASLEISKVQGINPDDVRALVDASDHLQFIMVGMNREHTALTISTPWITMCIPVHMSGGTVDNISARAVAQGDPGLTKADVNDATGCQNDKLMTEKELASTYKDNVDMVRLAREQRAAILSKSTDVDLNKIHMVDKWVSSKFPGNHRLLENMYNAFQKSGAQLKVEFNEDGTPKGLGFGIYPNEYWDTTSTIDNAYVNGDRFLEYCWMLGVKPRFSYGEYGKHGSFPGLPKFEGYWKVLIDRPMYNADGSYRTVRPVDVSRLTAAMFTGQAATASGFSMYNAEENAKMQRDEATAARVGREYSEGLTGTPEDAMRKHSRSTALDSSKARFGEQLEQPETANTTSEKELRKQLDAAAKNAGYNVRAYHGTKNAFSTFRGTSEMGYHFGTKAAAQGRVGRGRGSYLMERYLRVQNPIIFDYDLGSWDATYRLADELRERKILTPEEVANVKYGESYGRKYRRSDGEANKVLQKMLQEKGYDSIKYKNTMEAKPSWSYIVFDNDQIKPADLVLQDEAGNDVPVSRRFKPGSRYALAGDIDAKLAELRKQYGAMPTSGAETAPGRENVVLPRQTNDDTFVRRAAQTFMRSPNVTDAAASDIGKAVLRGEFNYERQTNEETEAKATRMMQDLGGQVGALRHLENVARGAARPSAETVALGEQLILDAMEIGDADAFEKAVAYTAMIGTAAGQTTQAFSMINKLSPQGIALYMTRVIERLNNVEYKDLIAKGKMKPIELTEDQVARIMSVKSFSEARQVETKILEEIGAQIPLTLKEQLRSWRYLCMLGNIRTNVRNLAGNLAMSSMVMGKNVVAAGLEAWDVARGRRLDQKAAEAARAGNTAKAERLAQRADRHLDQSDRTKALRLGNADAYKANLVYAKGTTADAIDLLKGGGKDVGLSALREGKRMFNPKWMDKAGKLIMKPLDVGDLWFSKPQYEHAYASWMTARGLTGEDMTLRQRSEAMKYAVNEAQKATFRDANWLATKITEIRSKNLVSELLIGGVMPFAKTPANILRRGIEYSPAGLISGITQLVKANNAEGLSRSERMQMRASAIDRMSAGVTGTGLLAIGMLLRKLGVLKGAEDDDSRAAKFFRDMGNQAYSVDFGDLNMTIDWLAPMNMPMFMGAAIWDAAEKLSQGEELALEDIADPIMSIADPLIEMSMLQGIQSALKTYGSENALSAIGTNTLQSFAGQFYPTIGGQLARTIDYTRRQPDSKQYWLQSMAAKVPGLSKTLKPYVGGYGEEETFEGSWFVRALEQFISPGYFKLESHDELTEELARIYEQTGVNKFLPQRPSDYKTLNLGKLYGTYDLTQDEQVEYEKLFRSEAAKALADAIKMPEYKGLSDPDKADFLSEVYDQATKAARADMKKTIIERHQVQPVAATQKP